MSAGKFVGVAAVAAIREWSPFAPENVGRRKANRAVRKILKKARKGKTLTPEEEQFMAENTSTVTLPSGEIITREEPTIPLRTSTKGVGIAGVGTAVSLVQMIQSIDWPGAWFDQFVQTDIFVAGLPLLVAWIVSRMSRSPAAPGAL